MRKEFYSPLNSIKSDPNNMSIARHIREGNGNPLQYSCLENPMDGGAWWAAVHGVAKSQTQLSDFTFTFHFHTLEEEMATHSRVLAWRIPGMGEPDGLPSMGSHRVGHDWSDLAAAAAAAARHIIHPDLRNVFHLPSFSLSVQLLLHHHPTPETFLLCYPGESQGPGSLVGCRLWGCTESDTTEAT